MKIEHGKEYQHRDWGRVLVVGWHPHDGALLVVERRPTTDPEDDELMFDGCEASDLSPVEGEQWPWLGFTLPRGDAS